MLSDFSPVGLPDSHLNEMHADWMEVHRNALAPTGDELEFMRLDFYLGLIERGHGPAVPDKPMHFDLGEYTPPEAALASMCLRGWKVHREIHSTACEFRLNGFQAHVYYTEDCRVKVGLARCGLKASVLAKLVVAKSRRGISPFARAMAADMHRAERRRATYGEVA